MSPVSRSAGVRRALLIVLLLNALSAVLKAAVGARTGALTVLGAALESSLDMLSNGVAIFAISIAARAPDDDHPYGHEKFDTLGTLGIVAFLAITCFELLRQSVGELTGEHTPPNARALDAMISATRMPSRASARVYPRLESTSDPIASTVTRMSLAVCAASASSSALPRRLPRRRS